MNFNSGILIWCSTDVRIINNGRRTSAFRLKRYIKLTLHLINANFQKNTYFK